jgi:hypothetical protein
MSNTKHITDQLSAYLDNRLSAGDRARVEAHLRGCEQCRRDLAELGYTVNMVRALPVMRRPRTYTLAEVPVAQHWALGWLYRLMGSATLAAALLLVVVLSADMLSLGGRAASPAPPMAMSAATAASATGNAADTARAAEAPKAAPTPAAATQVMPTPPSFAPAPTVGLGGGPPPTTAAAAPTTRPPAPTVGLGGGPPATPSPLPTGPSQPSTAGVISVTATATLTPTVTPSPTATATITPTATPSPSPTATSAPPPPPRPSATPQTAPAPASGIAPARLVEFALAVFVLGGLGLTLLLRALRPS